MLSQSLSSPTPAGPTAGSSAATPATTAAPKSAPADADGVVQAVTVLAAQAHLDALWDAAADDGRNANRLAAQARSAGSAERARLEAAADAFRRRGARLRTLAERLQSALAGLA